MIARLRRHPGLMAFVATFVVAVTFAWYTQHVWEDYYITYRSSRNLAVGNGLVYNPGDHLHTFTSPLGVLLPSFALILTGNSSDTVALWIFRAMSAAALSGAAAFLVNLGRRHAFPTLAVFLLAAFLACDAKSVDFTINGMETGFMLLFAAYALWSQFHPSPRSWLHLGCAWAGLMWTRPDSFIYIALIAIGTWIFNRSEITGANRTRLLVTYLKAGALTVALYGPWLAWAAWYYGTPIPHTITAKAAQGAGLAWPQLMHGFWRLPYLIARGETAAEGAFLPAYYLFPSWPAWMIPFGRTLAVIASVLWLLPRVRLEARVASFAFYGGACYLSFVPYYPFPWYFPTIALFAFVALAGVIGQLWGKGSGSTWLRSTRVAVATLVVVLLAAEIRLTLGVAQQVQAQQEFVENRNRRAIGEWLHAHADKGDTVFMEPLGYIGYFSELKTYDWPGLSSREMVTAERMLGRNWIDLICYLQPTWIVMRATGEGDLPQRLPELVDHYRRVIAFDQTGPIRALDVPGRRMLEFDARFVVYRLEKPMRQDADGLEIATPVGSTRLTIGSASMRLVHAPGNVIARVPVGATSVDGQFGFPPDVTNGDVQTDGAEFALYWFDGRERTLLFSRTLHPHENVADRTLQSFHVPLPARDPNHAEARLILQTSPLATMTKDWTCWSDLTFR
ncbi:MAG TPA: hypothetical protein VHD32_05325 [Candidatus Didemnitutus sp.]|nr:hypothetical protein [Candidatus Didemnitutus sp.]